MENWKKREKSLLKNILFFNLLAYFILSMSLAVFGSEKNDTFLEAITPDSIQND